MYGTAEPTTAAEVRARARAVIERQRRMFAVSPVSTGLPRPVENRPAIAAILTLAPVAPVPPVVALKDILHAVERASGIGIMDLVSPRRAKHIVHARVCFYVLARELTPASLPMIGRHCGGRDHTTVINGLRCYEREPGRYAALLEAVRARLE